MIIKRNIPATLQQEVDEQSDAFLHYLKGYIMVAGGVEISREKLLSMTLQEAFDSFYPNGLRFGVTFNQLLPEYRQFKE
jgi:hypothetical protein